MIVSLSPAVLPDGTKMIRGILKTERHGKKHIIETHAPTRQRVLQILTNELKNEYQNRDISTFKNVT